MLEESPACGSNRNRRAGGLCRFRRFDAPPQRRNDRRLQILLAFAMDPERGGIDARIGVEITIGKYRHGPGPKLGHERAGASGMARIPRGESRRALSRAKNFHELERSAAAGTLEDPSRACLVVVCRGRSHAFHPGAAWPEGDRGLL